jgi:hypothetical protein
MKKNIFVLFRVHSETRRENTWSCSKRVMLPLNILSVKFIFSNNKGISRSCAAGRNKIIVMVNVNLPEQFILRLVALEVDEKESE